VSEFSFTINHKVSNSSKLVLC